MRSELGVILSQRYSQSNIDAATLIEPTSKNLEDYQRHNGLLSLLVNLDHDPGLVIVDTGGLIHLRHAWIGNRWLQALRLVVSSGIQPISPDSLRVQTYDQKVEGLELTFHYNQGHRKRIPYSEELKPLW